MRSVTSTTPDTTLRRAIAAIEANPKKPGKGIEITLYLPWGVVTGELASRRHFDQRSASYLREHGEDDLGKAIDPKDDAAPPEAAEYIHLHSDVLCVFGDKVVEHKVLRVRLADVTAWTFGHPKRHKS